MDATLKTRFTDLPAYQLVMLVLSLYALGSLAVQITTLDPEVRSVLDFADYGVCLLFFLDFCASLYAAPNRGRYFVSWGWLDLLSSIPMLDAARWGRIARILRIFRVLRGIRATKMITTVVLRHRAANAFLAATLLALLLIVSCSIAVLNFESVPDGNIKTADDALWWAFSTITTVGYGDRFPVTAEGRIVAVVLMCAGVGLFGTFSGFLAAWFLAPEEDQSQSEIAELREEIKALRESIEHSNDTKRMSADRKG